jgi:hypothetical protein
MIMACGLRDAHCVMAGARAAMMLKTPGERSKSEAVVRVLIVRRRRVMRRILKVWVFGGEVRVGRK